MENKNAQLILILTIAILFMVYVVFDTIETNKMVNAIHDLQKRSVLYDIAKYSINSDISELKQDKKNETQK